MKLLRSLGRGCGGVGATVKGLWRCGREGFVKMCVRGGSRGIEAAMCGGVL